jgi:hypothetical protein
MWFYKTINWYDNGFIKHMLHVLWELRTSPYVQTSIWTQCYLWMYMSALRRLSISLIIKMTKKEFQHAKWWHSSH